MGDGGGYCHEALLYRGTDDLLTHTLQFVSDGVDAAEPVLVVLDEWKNDLLRDALGGDAELVQFADMAQVGANPARIIPVWQEFVDTNRGRRIRGIGEPVGAHRRGAELFECHRHEALLNIAFEDSQLWLLCPYDVETLDPAVVAEARRTHPVLRSDEGVVSSDAYDDMMARKPFTHVLPDPAAGAEELEFDSLREVREVVGEQALVAGIDAERAADLVVAVNEIATNSLRHGGGAGRLRVWRDEPWFVCEVRDRGLIDEPLAGRRVPPADSEGGRGLWMANQLCDLVQLESTAAGTAVRLHIRL